MAHILDGTDIEPVNFSKLGIELLRTKVALLPRIYTEVRPQQVSEGGNKFWVYPPTTTQEPADFDPDANHHDATFTHEITREPVAAEWTEHKYFRLDWTKFESRLAIGNFEAAFKWAFGGYIDGIARAIERDIASKYTHAARFAGVNTDYLDDDVMREALIEISKENVIPNPQDVSMIVSPQVYYRDLLGEDRYARADAAGNKAALVNNGKLNDFYDLHWDSSPAIIGSYGSGGATVHNMLFHRYALGISFKEFEPVSKYVDSVGQNVEEGQLTDPESNITIRTQIYYDPRAKRFVLELDVAWGCYSMVPGYMIDVRSKP